MKLSNKGKIALAVSEGIADTAYKDTQGVWTIGIGHAETANGLDPKKYIGKTMSIKEIFDLFTTDIVEYENYVNSNVKVSLTQNEFDALVHFVYNIGGGGFKRSQLLKNLNAGDKKLAFTKGFHGWLKNPELKGRRDKERDMALTGAYGGSVATLFTADAKGNLKRKGTIDLSKQDLFGNAPLVTEVGGATPTETKPTTTPSSKPTESTNTPAEEKKFGFLDFVMWILSLFSKSK